VAPQVVLQHSCSLALVVEVEVVGFPWKPLSVVIPSPLSNRHSTMFEAKMQLALLRDDHRLFQEVVADYPVLFDGMLADDSCCTNETYRDLWHCQAGLGGLVQIAEMAWQQGVDLYSHR